MWGDLAFMAIWGSGALVMRIALSVDYVKVNWTMSDMGISGERHVRHTIKQIPTSTALEYDDGRRKTLIGSVSGPNVGGNDIHLIHARMPRLNMR